MGLMHVRLPASSGAAKTDTSMTCVGPLAPASCRSGTSDKAWADLAALHLATDSEAARKQRLKKAMLRWHPDKFLATNGTRIRPDELPAVTERLGAVLQRVQQERLAFGCAPGVE